MADVVSRIIDFRAHADRPAVITGADTLSYAQIETRIDAICAYMSAQGVMAGDRVAFALPKSVAGLLLFLAILRSGAVAVPINPAQPEEAIANILACAGPKLVLTSSEALGGVTVDDMWLPGILDAYAGAQMVDLVPLGADDPALILFTSGTTGAPKGVVHSVGSLEATARALASVWEITEADILLHALPTYHAHGLIVSLLPLLSRGAEILPHTTFEPRRILRDLPRATVMMGVPFHYQQLLSVPGLGAAGAGIRLFTCGSAPLPPALAEAFRAEVGKDLAERYGMTETMISTANSASHLRRGTVGRALEGVELRIRDPQTDTICAANQVGELELRGPTVFSGYIGTDVVAPLTDDGFFKTGDLGEIDEDGYLTLRGRSKDLIIYCGINVYPGDVEAELEALPGVASACVFGVPDQMTGEAVYAALVVDQGCATTPAEFRLQLARKVASHRVPKRIFLVDAFPRNPMGKIDRRKLCADLNKT